MKSFKKQIPVMGKQLEVVWHGPLPEDAPTLIFLHEGLGCIDMWQDFPEKLAAATGLGALVYSRAGYGASDPCSLPRPLEYMTEEGLGVLPELIADTGIRDCVLIGNSDGGSIALIYAGGTAAAPLRGVITLAAHVFCEDISVRSIQQAKKDYEAGWLRAKLKKYHGDNTDTAFWGWNDAWLHPDFMKWNIEKFLPGVRVPLLVTQGESDKYGTKHQVDAIVRGVSGEVETLMIPECNHWPHLEYPERMQQVMSKFIERVLK
jgi:pimeloyl-ACP methyl ester carboxylesterase